MDLDAQTEPTTTAQPELAMEAPGDQEASGVDPKQGEEKAATTTRVAVRRYEVWPGNEVSVLPF